MTWAIAGLICGEIGCIWYIPVTDRTYMTEAHCLSSIALDRTEELVRFRAGGTLYLSLKCRLTDLRRME